MTFRAFGAAARRELLTGLALGAIVGAAFLPFAWLAWGDGQVDRDLLRGRLLDRALGTTTDPNS